MKLFISYSWDNHDHKEWVRKLANDLLKNGIVTILDQYELKIGHNMKNFMTESISKSDKVLIILTDNYKLKAENLVGGVGFEYSILKEELFENIKHNNKFIPIVRQGTTKSAMPVFLNSFLAMDMTHEENYVNQLEILLRQLYGEEKHNKPELGIKPDFFEQDLNNPNTKNIKVRNSSIESFAILIQDLANKDSEIISRNNRSERSIIVLQQIFKMNIGKSVSIYIKDANDKIYNDKHYLESLEEYVKNKENRLNIIIGNKENKSDNTNLAKLIFNWNAEDNIKILFLDKSISPDYQNFTFGESKAFRIVIKDNLSDIWSFNNNGIVEKLRIMFDELLTTANRH